MNEIPNFMPYNPFMQNNDQINKNIDRIYHELETIEKRLTSIENSLNIKNSKYLSSDVTKGDGLYML